MMSWHALWRVIALPGMTGKRIRYGLPRNTLISLHRFRKETLDDSLQPTIDMLLNVAIFMWLGAVCPWRSFAHNSIVPIYRLVPLGILILILRRLPTVYAMHKYIPQIEDKRQALFVGFFGPIGISAIFYLYISIEFLRDVTAEDKTQREDAAKLSEAILVVVWFLVMCSIVSLLFSH